MESRSDVQQSAESAMLTAFAEQEGFVWGDANDVPGLVKLGIKLDGVFVLDDGTVLIAEAWAHQGQAKGSQPSKVAGDVLKLSYAKSVLEKEGKIVRACMLFASQEAANTLMNSGWRGAAASHFGIEPVMVEIDETARKMIRDAQRNQNFYRPDSPRDI